MKINYLTTMQDQFVTRTKSGDMKYTHTDVTCPLCRNIFSIRSFEGHVYEKHPQRVDECFAKLYGAPWPARCSCGKELHYSPSRKGFPTQCGSCVTGTVGGGVKYKNAAEAEQHVAQLTAYLEQAKAEAKRLAKEAELSRTPLNELPFPTRKDPRLLKRIANDMRTYAINGDKDNLIQLANFIDGQLERI